MATRAIEPGSLSLAEQVCLTAVQQGSEHGWAIGTLLAADGELGRIWTLSRPLTYRAIDSLVERRLLRRRGTRSGRGRDRTILSITPAGSRTVAAWLDAPVDHLREVRTVLLLKLAFRQRAGADLAPLLVAQQRAFAAVIDALVSSAPDGDVVDLWRRETARAVKRFLDHALHPERLPSLHSSGTSMKLSARNQLRARAASVTHGDVMSTVKVTLPDGQQLTAAITKDAAEDLDVVAGDPVVAIVKSTEVMIATATGT